MAFKVKLASFAVLLLSLSVFGLVSAQPNGKRGFLENGAGIGPMHLSRDGVSGLFRSLEVDTDTPEFEKFLNDVTQIEVDKIFEPNVYRDQNMLVAYILAGLTGGVESGPWTDIFGGAGGIPSLKTANIDGVGKNLDWQNGLINYLDNEELGDIANRFADNRGFRFKRIVDDTGSVTHNSSMNLNAADYMVLGLFDQTLGQGDLDSNPTALLKGLGLEVDTNLTTPDMFGMGTNFMDPIQPNMFPIDEGLLQQLVADFTGGPSGNMGLGSTELKKVIKPIIEKYILKKKLIPKSVFKPLMVKKVKKVKK